MQDIVTIILYGYMEGGGGNSEPRAPVGFPWEKS